jgi:hypothetical protein
MALSLLLPSNLCPDFVLFSLQFVNYFSTRLARLFDPYVFVLPPATILHLVDNKESSACDCTPFYLPDLSRFHPT